MSTGLHVLLTSYDPYAHPVCGPLLRGGPVALAGTYHLAHADRYVDECHFCSDLCKSLADQFPDHLAPRLVYGLND